MLRRFINSIAWPEVNADVEEPEKNHLDALSDDEASTSVTDLDASGAETAPDQAETPSGRSRIIGILQIALILLLMVAALYYSRAPAVPASVQGMQA